LPEFSRLAAQKRVDALRRSLRLHLGLALTLLSAAAAVMMWGSAELVRWMFQRGQFGAAEAASVTGIQQVTLVLVPIAVALTISQRMATAIGASHLILRAGIGATVANMVGDLLLPRWFGVRGVAMAYCAAYAVFLIGLLVLLYLRERRLFLVGESR
jgi:peptidoglycan biosynthesis protein MviN/MurJ (putative lipid II flippase)